VLEVSNAVSRKAVESPALAPTFSIICLSSQEWTTPLPTNRQQIMRRAARRGHSVLFVETGEFVGRHILRLRRRSERRSLLRRLIGGERVEPQITVRKVLNVLPWGQRFAICNRVNGWVSRHVVRAAGRTLPAPRVTWLYDPRATWAIRCVGDAFGVYDCVDDYAEQTFGVRNRALVATADRRAAEAARLVFTTSHALRDRHLETNSRTHLVPNAGDFVHFAKAADRRIAAPVVAALPRPVLGFAGNITKSKVDITLLAALADRDPARTILLAGPAQKSTAEDLGFLTRRENVVWIGPVEYPDLPTIIAAFDVGLIPYAENEYTRNVFPLKLYEYLAAGKPVVATGLPELGGFEPDVVLAKGVDDVELAIASALNLRNGVDVDRRQKLAAANTWEARTERLLLLTAAELAM
jgi:glycosyltransferase involved in cell wall biosynthesis